MTMPVRADRGWPQPARQPTAVFAQGYEEIVPCHQVVQVPRLSIVDSGNLVQPTSPGLCTLLPVDMQRHHNQLDLRCFLLHTHLQHNLKG